MKVDTSNQYDLPKTEFEKVRERVKLREVLKHEFNLRFHHPFRTAAGKPLKNPAIRRLEVALMNRPDHFKPRWTHFAMFGMQLGFLWAAGYFFEKRLEGKAEIITSGLIHPDFRGCKVY